MVSMYLRDGQGTLPSTIVLTLRPLYPPVQELLRDILSHRNFAFAATEKGLTQDVRRHKLIWRKELN